MQTKKKYTSVKKHHIYSQLRSLIHYKNKKYRIMNISLFDICYFYIRIKIGVKIRGKKESKLKRSHVTSRSDLILT